MASIYQAQETVMAHIQATNGPIIEVDNEYYEHLSQFTWSINGWGYAYSGMGLGRGVCVCMHKWVAEQAGLDTSNQIDHKDRNKLNNQASNLRPATRSQNEANKIKLPGCSSSYKGVSYDRAASKWYAQLSVNKKRVLRQGFENEIDAAKAYDKAAFEYNGEYAVLNFPEDYR